ncbi:hypothetical protein TWF481_003326 [Arthrobotrys musiformis]|uniref:Uncharacterized protein n=1 Tax=Arthrobotrys musiformis TaxID=47236 RepID=A0AAV9VPX6_9PEZI
MAFWESWQLFYKGLFFVGCCLALGCILSYVSKLIIAKIAEKLEAIYQVELTGRPRPLAEMQRSGSVNFGVRALDSRETPADSGIIDSESLRVFSPGPRFSRVSSPASTGGRKGSASTIGSVLEAPGPGLNVYGQAGVVPQFKYTPQMVPRSLPPFISPGLKSMYERASSSLGSSTSPNPAATQNTGLLPPGFDFQIPSAPIHGDIGAYFNVTGPHPYKNYSGKPLKGSRPISTHSIDEVIASLPRPQVIVNGILINRSQTPSPAQPNKFKRPLTPGPPKKSNFDGRLQADLPALPTLDPEQAPPLPRSKSAPPLNIRRSSTNPTPGSQNLSDIPEAFEGPDGIELTTRHRQLSAESTPLLVAGPSSSSRPRAGFIIPHPTRPPPPIPSTEESSTPSVGTPIPTVETEKQNAGARDKGKQKVPSEPWHRGQLQS